MDVSKLAPHFLDWVSLHSDEYRKLEKHLSAPLITCINAALPHRLQTRDNTLQGNLSPVSTKRKSMDSHQAGGPKRTKLQPTNSDAKGSIPAPRVVADRPICCSIRRDGLSSTRTITDLCGECRTYVHRLAPATKIFDLLGTGRLTGTSLNSFLCKMVDLEQKGVHLGCRVSCSSKSANRAIGQNGNECNDGKSSIDGQRLVADWRMYFSNFALVAGGIPVHTPGGRIRCPTVEHAFQLQKFVLCNKTKGIEILSQLSQKDAQRFQVRPDEELTREQLKLGASAQKQRKCDILSPEELKEWEDSKREWMQQFVFHKFATGTIFADLLLATGNAHLIHVPNRQPQHGNIRRQGSICNHTYYAVMAARARLQSL